MPKTIGHRMRDWAGLALGVVIMAFSYSMFFIENQLAPGGLTGIATVLNHLWSFPVGLMTFALNLPLFLVSFRRKGGAFVARSFLAMVSVSLVIDLVPVPVVTTDPMLAAIAGGVCLGAGLGLVMRVGATTGGTDMAAILLHERYPVLSVGAILLAVDVLVILSAGIVFDFQAALYSMIALYLSTKVMDQLVEGFNTAKAFFIISDAHADIARTILERMDRGVTLLKSQGGYSGAERDVLLCVVTRLQILQLKRIVAGIDPHAFVIITDVHEAMGEGFGVMRHSGR